MGDLGDITINQAWEDNPKFGKTCIKIVYSGKGSGPHSDGGNTPSKWAGTYWQEPANNWGTEARLKDSGFNLSKYDQLTFWARADEDCEIEFKVGGMTNPFGDSMNYPASLAAHLTKDWQPFKISLKNADLHHIVGGFCWVSNQDTNPGGATFYLDEIRFEKTTP
jgi:hypothetical protein